MDYCKFYIVFWRIVIIFLYNYVVIFKNEIIDIVKFLINNLRILLFVESGG